ncbi:MAG: hypothetical protein HUJ26_03385 [Planctomycetaceae bacterium]|nr:hypothetical protein [Planctomycetaceae bacterium]
MSAKVSGREVWFESTTPLNPSAEAFAGAFFLPALHTGRTLNVESTLDEHWLAETEKLLPTLHKWWGYPQESPLRAETGQAHQSEPRNLSTSESSGLCFSCGADSFYSLLKRDSPPSDLVYAHGYDIPVDDRQRFQTLEPSLREVSRERDVSLHVIRTNLRTHPLFKKVSWDRTHGAALAALGHLLGDQISRLVIAPSYRYECAHPWGSSWLLDPHWSSSTVRIEHDDATLGRYQKIQSISQISLAQKHLQVCWSLRSESGNCGECEKCLRTMVILEFSKALHLCRTFPQKTSLSELIDRQPKLPSHLHATWKELRDLSHHPETQAAIDRWFDRSANASNWWRRLAG